jgi:hypothetical protein
LLCYSKLPAKSFKIVNVFKSILRKYFKNIILLI